MTTNHKDLFSGLSEAFYNKKIVANLPLCLVVLENNKNNPWIILIPKINNVIELIDLNNNQQMQLLQELNLMSRVIKDVFNADKLNIASFGNVTPQLHFHIMARYTNATLDKHFPKPLFDLDSEKMTDAEQNERILKINQKLTDLQ